MRGKAVKPAAGVKSLLQRHLCRKCVRLIHRYQMDAWLWRRADFKTMQGVKMPVTVKVDINVLLVAVTAFGLLTRLYNIQFPRAVVWVFHFFSHYKTFACVSCPLCVQISCNSLRHSFDEVYYGQFVSLYMKRVFFIDESGPPFGHMILALGGENWCLCGVGEENPLSCTR